MTGYILPLKKHVLKGMVAQAVTPALEGVEAGE